jgi:hypothetical protein
MKYDKIKLQRLDNYEWEDEGHKFGFIIQFKRR